jgi:hypothetical protein
LALPRVTDFAFTVLFGIAIPEVFPGDRVLIRGQGQAKRAMASGV